MVSRAYLNCLLCGNGLRLKKRLAIVQTGPWALSRSMPGLCRGQGGGQVDLDDP